MSAGSASGRSAYSESVKSTLNGLERYDSSLWEK